MGQSWGVVGLSGCHIGIWSGVHCGVGCGGLGLGAEGGAERVLGFRCERGWMNWWVMGHPVSVGGSLVWRRRGD